MFLQKNWMKEMYSFKMKKAASKIETAFYEFF